MSAIPPPGRPGVISRDQALRAIKSARSDVPTGPVTPQEAASVIADLADHLAGRTRPMLDGPHPPDEWRRFIRWLARASPVQSIVELLAAAERMASDGSAGDGLRAAAEVVRSAALDLPRARIRRTPAWNADLAGVEDDPYDPHGYEQRRVYQERLDPEDARDIEERLDRLVAAADWLWWAACSGTGQPAKTERGCSEGEQHPTPTAWGAEAVKGKRPMGKRPKHRAANGGLTPTAYNLLTALAEARQGVTGEEAADAAGTSHDFARKVLPGLVADGLVTRGVEGYRITPAGRAAV